MNMQSDSNANNTDLCAEKGILRFKCCELNLAIPWTIFKKVVLEHQINRLSFKKNKTCQKDWWTVLLIYHFRPTIMVFFLFYMCNFSYMFEH